MKKKRPSRALFAIVFGLPLLIVLPLAVVGSSMYQGGTIELEVMEHNGACVEATVPASIVPFAMHFMPNHVLDEIRCEIESEAEFALPVAKAALLELSRCEDGVIVDVRDGNDIVQITKREGHLEVLVDSSSEYVRVSVPIQVFSSVMSHI